MIPCLEPKTFIVYYSNRFLTETKLINVTLAWGWIEREHGIASSHEQHFTVIRRSSVTPARDYDSHQSLDTWQFYLPRLAVLSRNKLREYYLV